MPPGDRGHWESVSPSPLVPALDKLILTLQAPTQMSFSQEAFPDHPGPGHSAPSPQQLHRVITHVIPSYLPFQLECKHHVTRD